MNANSYHWCFSETAITRLGECLACNKHLLRPDLVDMAAKKFFVEWCVQGAVRRRRSLQNSRRFDSTPASYTHNTFYVATAQGLDAEGRDASSSGIATILYSAR
uniref:Uncharacterized protein n=1 Tax=Timema monikensis TaxID=170555 RepID=A0A7R9E494_9NEOP|nr:unnamed protein product [Timema monikensis]